jgi:hypothetical protein
MTQQLYLRCKCEILFQRDGNPVTVDDSGGPYTLDVLKGGKLVRVEVMQDGTTVEGKTVIDTPSHILDILSAVDYDSLSDAQKKALSELQAPVTESIKQLVLLLKQELPKFDIDDELIGNCKYEWSIDEKTWQRVPFGLQAYMSMLRIGSLGRAKADHIQDLLSRGEAALIATNHLHRAQAERGLRYKWIDATIAAELAIKEILIRMEPKLEVILTELPSPPLRTLYGEVLKSIAGVSASEDDLKKLGEGSRIRNRLIHSPESVPLDHNKVTNYVQFVDHLIEWLLEVSRIRRRKALQQGIES